MLRAFSARNVVPNIFEGASQIGNGLAVLSGKSVLRTAGNFRHSSDLPKTSLGFTEEKKILL